MAFSVLLIGNGAREHSIAKAIARSREKPELYSFMAAKNPGIIKLSKEFIIAKLDDFEKLREFISKIEPEFAVIGPEAPLEAGIADFLLKQGIGCVGPLKELARLETSKGFTRLLMKKYRIKGQPEFKLFYKKDYSKENIKEFLTKLESFVIKPDGLTGGKGVKVSGEHLKTVDDGVDYCIDVLKTHPAVVVEEKLEGEEFSLQCITDGTTVKATPPVQDHKRAYVGDKGPNTGGMGSYSCENHLLPFIEEKHVKEALEITQKMAASLYEETGEYYKGVMYGGFILTNKGVKLIEYNARFGDPEAMNVFPLLKTDFVEVCRAVVNGELDKIELEFENKATVCKYAVPKGYPTEPVKGEKVSVDDIKETEGKLEMFYASVDENKDGELIMSGSRAIAFVGIADSTDEAEQLAQAALEKVKGPIEFRKDIGTKELLQKRVEHIRNLTNS